VATAILPLTHRTLPSVLAVRRLLKEWRPDVINPHSSVDSWLVAIARLGRNPRLRVVRTRHLSANVPRNFASRWVYNSGADFVMTTGEAIVDALSADGFMPRSRLAAVPTGIDADVFKPGDKAVARASLALPRDKFLFGIAATLRSWKGHSYLLDALKLASDPRMHVVIVGDGPQQDNLEKQIAALGIAGQVTMAGRQNDIVPYMQAFDVFMLPSYANEGVPQALLQAMASGLPVIACPIGGIPECTRGLGSVTLVPPKDTTALAAAMKKAVLSRPDPAELARARDRVIAEHSREVMYRKALRHFTGGN
jgi:glycosyltransferase involved in cell wall biosynthesis